MYLQNEDQILDEGVRKKILEEMNGPENRRRKDESYKRYLCYKDFTYLYVIRKLLLQFDRDTVGEMQYALSNLALVKKIIDKLARVYSYGVDRSAEDDEATSEAIEFVEKHLDVNTLFKKTNRFLKLEKNCMQYIIPTESTNPAFPGRKRISARVLLPHFYDVVEHHENREVPMALILSDYKPYDQGDYSPNAAFAGRPYGGATPARQGDGVDQVIADTPADQQMQRIVWWTNKYHFTTDGTGRIVSQDFINPIGKLPFVNYAIDQDNAFWAIGGGDLTDGSILVNALITHLNHIAVTQGYGQIVMKGKNLPRSMRVGPNKAIILEYEKDNDPVPEFSFESANPPIDQVQKLIEMYVAMLLTTNNLSTAGVASNLNGGSQFPSGIAMMIDKAESMEDIKDQQQVFVDNEPKFWNIVASWHLVLKNTNELDEDFAKVSFAKDFELKLKFKNPTAIETEKERLDNLKLKKELGLISALDMIKDEYPEFTDEQAQMKLKEILEEKLQKVAAFGVPTNESNQDVRNEQQDEQSDRPGDSEGDEPGDESSDPE
jgi:hypothetical protein